MLHHHYSFTYLLPAPSNLQGSDNPEIFFLAHILSTSKPFKSPSLPSNFIFSSSYYSCINNYILYWLLCHLQRSLEN